jgi:exonuclease SbcC
LRATETSLAEAHSARSDVVGELELQTASLAEELGSTRARATERAAEIKRIEAELEAAQRLVADRDHLVARRDVMQRLAGDLTDSKFIRFLLDEERAVLSELGTEHLLRLTSGRYEFDDSGAFNIVDLTAADAVRKPDSLSGGETFLASLALALGLAEMVARTGGRLDAFFLDEGFGSLDPEHLDLAMEGIESLVADDNDRLVVVVSHVPELRHRLEDLIELDRSPTTGDTRVVRA